MPRAQSRRLKKAAKAARLNAADRLWDFRNFLRPRAAEVILVGAFFALILGGSFWPVLFSSDDKPSPAVSAAASAPSAPIVQSEETAAMVEPLVVSPDRSLVQNQPLEPVKAPPLRVIEGDRLVTVLEKLQALPLPQVAVAPEVVAPSAPPSWQSNAVPVVLGQGPKIALVIDDLGPGVSGTKRTIALPGPLTLAFLPYASGLKDLTGSARQKGHELLVHLPWEPMDLDHNNPGPDALLTSLSNDELQRRLDEALASFDGYVGINNHMGSAFSTYLPGLQVVMQEAQARGLLFLDSRTIGGSLAEATAISYGVPAAGRDVFLDHEANDPAFVWRQLATLEILARRNGVAVAIGHPHASTLSVLEAWIPDAMARGFQFIPISAVVEMKTPVRQLAEGAALDPETQR